jgi:hypothetical protein
MKCEICEFETENVRAHATHLQTAHKLSTKEYTIKYILKSITEPKCAYGSCNNDVRYVSFKFKKYCKEHAKLAMQEAGKKGGAARAWNKDLTKNNDERVYAQSMKNKGVNNHFYGKKHAAGSCAKMHASSKITKKEYYERLLKRCVIHDNENTTNKDFKLLTNYADYKSRQRQYLKFICLKCGDENNKTLMAFERGSKCWKCYPLSNHSNQEVEVKDFICTFIDSSKCIFNTKQTITPKELDIYISEKNFAIEYNGLYWHTEDQKGKTYHLDKTDACKAVGIQLFHIFSDEWTNKKDIIKSMIQHRVGCAARKIPARKCTIREISNKEGHSFFDRTHISGNTPARGYFGLFHTSENKEELVACLSFRKPVQNKKYANTIEIARFATELNTAVIGGFSKLFKQLKNYAKENGFKNILTYADRRFGEGGVYLTAGFVYFGSTPIDYWYTDGLVRHFRFKFRAQPGKPEKQVAAENGVFKIFGCGSNIYQYQLS